MPARAPGAAAVSARARRRTLPHRGEIGALLDERIRVPGVRGGGGPLGLPEQRDLIVRDLKVLRVGAVLADVAVHVGLEACGRHLEIVRPGRMQVVKADAPGQQDAGVTAHGRGDAFEAAAARSHVRRSLAARHERLH